MEIVTSINLLKIEQFKINEKINDIYSNKISFVKNLKLKNYLLNYQH